MINEARFEVKAVAASIWTIFKHRFSADDRDEQAEIDQDLVIAASVQFKMIPKEHGKRESKEKSVVPDMRAKMEISDGSNCRAAAQQNIRVQDVRITQILQTGMELSSFLAHPHSVCLSRRRSS